MELTKKQEIIVKSFEKYLDIVFEKHNEHLSILELGDFEVTPKEFINVFKFDINYDFYGDQMPPDMISSFVDDIWKFSDFTKLFLPDKEPFFSYNFVRVSD
jgi:hypothetical protein